MEHALLWIYHRSLHKNTTKYLKVNLVQVILQSLTGMAYVL